MTSNRLTILIVDDSTTARTLIRKALEGKIELVAQEACDGAEGFQKTQEQKFDLILSDYNMPNVNGLQFIEMVRKSGNQNSQTPVILITAEVGDVKAISGDLPKVLFMTKPIIPKALIQNIIVALKM